ncbi:hypothetical protein KUTeg_016528 [Tegillarca granosa]|uniref:Sulfotransferase n=1 Tax=Tegillarca granosa TaxID=220873 RepID=A0ABQ9ERS6_TEGGR|nr:hypothetical protein KUTeg_016528 [Tegillarca granosa]
MYLQKRMKWKKDQDSTSSSRGKILLLTYCRSGSTFTSEILQQDEDVFFWFEPFRVTLYDEFLKYIPKKGITFLEKHYRRTQKKSDKTLRGKDSYSQKALLSSMIIDKL